MQHICVRVILACAVLCACAVTLCDQPARAAITRAGTLRAVVVDDFPSGSSSTHYTLASGGKEITVRPTELMADAGDRVVVKGEIKGDRLVGAVEAVGGGTQAALATGARKAAVLLVGFGSGGSWSSAEARSTVFTGANSVSAFYQEESYDAISLTGKLDAEGDVFGVYDLASPVAGCPYETWREDANDAAAAAGVDLSGYQHLIYQFSYQASCSWLGNAEINGDWAMINGNLLGNGGQVAAHELGHNLGLLHAGSWTCTSGGVRVQISETCTTTEYGDPFDTMGNIGFRHNNGWNLDRLGILSAENVVAVEASGNYSIRSALDPSSEPTVLRIPRTRNASGVVTSWYFLEVRETGGIFENVVDSSTTGVSVRVAPPETRLLDANPQTSTFADAPLAVGQTFDAGPVQVTTLAAGAGSASVSIELDEEAPTAPAGLTAVAAGESVQLEWDASSDNFDVARYRVFRDGSQVGVAEGTSLLDPAVAVGEHTYLVYAEDESGNKSGASGPATVTIEPDEEPPSAPTGLSAAMGPEGVQLEWDPSSDNFGVAHYRVFRDGSHIGGTGSGTSFLDSFSAAGEHSYVVYAEDNAGNRSAASGAALATVPEIYGPSCASGTCTVIYRHSGAPAAWTVPAGVSQAVFTVEGAQGGSDRVEALAGRGARIVAALDSLGGEEATIEVGGAGEPEAAGGDGGFNGGGDGALGGGGGGFSAVTLGSTLKLLASGGGGEGAHGFNSVTEAEPTGGAGGRGGELGGAGSAGGMTEVLGATLGRGNGGGGGGNGGAAGSGGQVTGTSGCVGGALVGAAGGAGGALAGGGGVSGAGGGGGGGYVGGGQGGGGARDECGNGAGSGGGGGGSSFAASGLSASFTLGIRRGYGLVSIAYQNPIAASARAYTTEPDRELSVPAASGVLSGASGPGGVSLSAGVFNPPDHGSLTLDEDGSFTYVPGSGYAGGDSFSYRVTDPSGDHADGQVNLTVAEPPSVSIDVPIDGSTYEMGDSASASFSCSEGLGGPGIATCQGPVPAGGFIDTSTVGVRSFTVTATSVDGLTGQATVAYTVEEPVPVANPPLPQDDAPLPEGEVSASLPTAKIGKARKLVRSGVAKIPVSCSGAFGAVCKGVVSLSISRRQSRHHRHSRARSSRVILLGRTRYSVPSGETAPVRVKLRRAALRRVRREGKRALRVRAIVTVAGGASTGHAILLRLQRKRAD